MTKSRLEAFSDGVIAIIITIMVLELKAPRGSDWHALVPLLPVFLGYILSFIFIGIYWNNHHHLLHAAERINGRVLWANLHLLFWLSLVPFTTAWAGEHPHEALPAAAYGTVLLAAAIAYWVLQRQLLSAQPAHSRMHGMFGRDLKGNVSPLLYLTAIASAFVNTGISALIYVSVALIWLVPDRRIERHYQPKQEG